MKKILITGANSFVGISFENWLKQWPDGYQVETVDMIGDGWKVKDFSGYDTVFHVAGIAHVTSDPKLEPLYNKVNRDLTIETATKAKADGVNQFIFMSSIIVYGESSSINKKRVINRSTVPNSANVYGNSKLQAESGINTLQDDHFNVVVLRPPMIYGRGSKGNYPKLSKFARKLPFFPDFENERSMLHIDNLCEFIRLMIDNNEQGVFFPQNKDYVKTTEMVRLIAETHGRKIRLTKVFNPLLRLLGHFVDIVNKVFGNLVYDQSISDYKVNYRVRDLKQSIIASELD